MRGPARAVLVVVLALASLVAWQACAADAIPSAVGLQAQVQP